MYLIILLTIFIWYMDVHVDTFDCKVHQVLQTWRENNMLLQHLQRSSLLTHPL